MVIGKVSFHPLCMVIVKILVRRCASETVFEKCVSDEGCFHHLWFLVANPNFFKITQKPH